jgi:hypothetical protein
VKRFTLRVSAFATAAGLALALLGCGGKPERVHISGKVTFQGNPVQYGNIVFEPDQSKGNRGPQGYAKITRQGTFDTAIAGTGPCPGPQVVTIEAYPDLESPTSKKSRVVLQYRMHMDLPAEATTRDFEVPASAARKEAVSELPPP